MVDISLSIVPTSASTLTRVQNYKDEDYPPEITGMSVTWSVFFTIVSPDPGSLFTIIIILLPCKEKGKISPNLAGLSMSTCISLLPASEEIQPKNFTFMLCARPRPHRPIPVLPVSSGWEFHCYPILSSRSTSSASLCILRGPPLFLSLGPWSEVQ